MESEPDDDLTDEPSMAEIGKLAQAITTVMIDVAISENTSLNWQDVVFAAALAMKGVAEITAQNRRMIGEDPGNPLEQVRSLFGQAMMQPVLTRHFDSKEEMDAWLAEHGMAVEDEPGGSVH